MMFTQEEWRESSDVFPMEYADMVDRHKVLAGASPFEGIRVSKADLRIELEHEARGKLLALRQGVLASAGDRKAELQLLAASLSTIMVIFRAGRAVARPGAVARQPRLSRSVAGGRACGAGRVLVSGAPCAGRDEACAGRRDG